MDIGTRPGQLDGCWQTWDEQDVDVVARTEMESGALHTRRRFTGRSRIVRASVKLPASLYSTFMDWFHVNQQQGAAATYVMTPYGAEELFQWTAPPQIAWVDKNVFQATVSMYQGAHFP